MNNAKYKMDPLKPVRGPTPRVFMDPRFTMRLLFPDEDVTRSVWWHDVIINIPDSFDPSMAKSAYMLIYGHSNSNSTPSLTDDFFMEMQMIASTTRRCEDLLLLCTWL